MATSNHAVTSPQRWALPAAGLVVSMLHELKETRCQLMRLFVLDSSALTETFTLAATPLEQTWAQTADWWRARLSTAT